MPPLLLSLLTPSCCCHCTLLLLLPLPLAAAEAAALWVAQSLLTVCTMLHNMMAPNYRQCFLLDLGAYRLCAKSRWQCLNRFMRWAWSDEPADRWEWNCLVTMCHPGHKETINCDQLFSHFHKTEKELTFPLVVENPYSRYDILTIAFIRLTLFYSLNTDSWDPCIFDLGVLSFPPWDGCGIGKWYQSGTHIG